MRRINTWFIVIAIAASLFMGCSTGTGKATTRGTETAVESNEEVESVED